MTRPPLAPADNPDLVAALDGGMPLAEAARAWGARVDELDRISGVRGLPQSSYRDDDGASAPYAPPAEAARALEEIGQSILAPEERPPVCSARDRAICDALILDDVVLQDLGDLAGLSRERIRQILLRNTGLSGQKLDAHRQRVRSERRIERGERHLERALTEFPEATLAELGRMTGLTTNEVRDRVSVEEILLRKPPSRTATAFDKETILAEMRRVAALVGTRTLSKDVFDAHKAPEIVGHVRIIQIFGKWSTACAAAGLETSRIRHRRYDRSWSDEELLGWVRRYLSEVGAEATFADFTEWLRGHTAEGAPSSSTVRNRLGTWRRVVSAACVTALRDVSESPAQRAQNLAQNAAENRRDGRRDGRRDEGRRDPLREISA